MPCTDYRPDPQLERAEDSVRALRARLDVVTDLLCKAGRANANGSQVPLDVCAWWDSHRINDAKCGMSW